MRHLGLALIAEGPTDERFLSPLLRRATIEACGQVCRGEVETGDVFLVGRLRGAPGKRLHEHILPTLRQVPAFRRFEADLKAVLQDLC